MLHLLNVVSASTCVVYSVNFFCEQLPRPQDEGNIQTDGVIYSVV